ncbi:MAG: type II toxin-antitoxin system RelE/ParE family toxin [Coriobacteriales bacterium]|nr:type II toxin-antitoxin system RelE/ParE family toxin [Coriobacteriales bacterium]
MRELGVRATDLFSRDLENAAAYYLQRAGERSASRFLSSFDEFCHLVAVFPGYGALVGDTELRWRKLGAFVAIYYEDKEAGEVILLRLYYISSDWRHLALGIALPVDAPGE